MTNTQRQYTAYEKKCIAQHKAQKTEARQRLQEIADREKNSRPAYAALMLELLAESEATR